LATRPTYRDGCAARNLKNHLGGRWLRWGNEEWVVFDIETTQTDGATVCRPTGDLDAETVVGFRERLTELATGTPVVVDLCGVPFMDSTGLGALIGGIRKIREAGGEAAVVCDRPAVQRLLHTTGFDRMVTVTATLAEALATLAQPTG